MDQQSPILQIQELHKSYRDGTESVEVLRGVSLEVPPQSLAVLAGPSGSGKSTLLNIIAGLDTADAGAVQVCGRYLFGLERDELAHFRLTSLGIVFQFFNLLPTLTLLQNVELPGHLLNKNTQEIRRRAEQLLELVALKDKLKRMPHELSGGEIQRGAIARALMNHPKLLLADEPTGNLDRQNGDIVLNVIQELIRVEKISAFVVTHDQHVMDRATVRFQIADGQMRNEATLS